MYVLLAAVMTKEGISSEDAITRVGNREGDLGVYQKVSTARLVVGTYGSDMVATERKRVSHVRFLHLLDGRTILEISVYPIATHHSSSSAWLHCSVKARGSRSEFTSKHSIQLYYRMCSLHNHSSLGASRYSSKDA